jgi:hypothetical protein
VPRTLSPRLHPHPHLTIRRPFVPRRLTRESNKQLPAPAPLPFFLFKSLILRSTIKAAASGRHYPEPLRAPLPIGSMRDTAVHTTLSPQPKGAQHAAKLGVVINASASAPQPSQSHEPANLLPNKIRGKEGHLASVAAMAGLHSSEAEPACETFKTMVLHCCGAIAYMCCVTMHGRLTAA